MGELFAFCSTKENRHAVAVDALDDVEDFIYIDRGQTPWTARRER